MIIDLFAGAGGWDCAARELGLPDPIGYELDNDACNTRRAANMPTEQVDIATAELPGRSGHPDKAKGARYLRTGHPSVTA